MKFNSIIDICDQLPDEAACVKYLEEMRWGGNPICPHCDSENPYVTNRGYKCRDCKKKFTVKVGTYYESSKLPLRSWFIAIFLLTTSKKGVSSYQLARQLKISQKSSWFLIQRIREMLNDENPEMLGNDKAVEVDEAYVGGKEQDKHYGKKRSKSNLDETNDGKTYIPKKTVIGIVERGGKVRLKFIPASTREHLTKTIFNNVKKGATVYTDEHRGYSQLYNLYNHGTVRHSYGEYKQGDACTNAIESVWSIVKRGIYGIYHHVSVKHFQRYLIEFEARFNTRHIGDDERFEKFIRLCNGRLSYKTLISPIDAGEELIRSDSNSH